MAIIVTEHIAPHPSTGRAALMRRSESESLSSAISYAITAATASGGVDLHGLNVTCDGVTVLTVARVDLGPGRSEWICGGRLAYKDYQVDISMYDGTYLGRRELRLGEAVAAVLNIMQSRPSTSPRVRALRIKDTEGDSLFQLELS